jgi:hypothetical protein
MLLFEISVSNQFDYALTNHIVDETAKKIINSLDGIINLGKTY